MVPAAAVSADSSDAIAELNVSTSLNGTAVAAARIASNAATTPGMLDTPSSFTNAVITAGAAVGFSLIVATELVTARMAGPRVGCVTMLSHWPPTSTLRNTPPRASMKPFILLSFYGLTVAVRLEIAGTTNGTAGMVTVAAFDIAPQVCGTRLSQADTANV